MRTQTGLLQETQSKSEMTAASAADLAIYHITHDLRGPVKALGILPDWIEEDLDASDGPDGTSVARHLADMRTQARRLDRMLVDLLGYSRVGRLGGADSAVALRELVAEKADQAGIGDRFVVRVRLGVEAIVAPRYDLGALMTALIDNAARHHDSTSGLVTVESMRVGNEVVLHVTDDGPGIAARHHETIFGLMTTLRPRDECDTSGVGLALVRRVAGTLGGSAQVLASGERGTTFEVRLPGWRGVELARGGLPAVAAHRVRDTR